MTEPGPGYETSYRVLSVRMSDDTRAQLEVLAQLNNRSLTEETRVALEHWTEVSRSDPKVKQRAESVRAEIEREAQTKRNAIAAIFGDSPAETSKDKPAAAAKGTGTTRQSPPASKPSSPA